MLTFFCPLFISKKETIHKIHTVVKVIVVIYHIALIHQYHLLSVDPLMAL